MVLCPLPAQCRCLWSHRHSRGHCVCSLHRCLLHYPQPPHCRHETRPPLAAVPTTPAVMHYYGRSEQTQAVTVASELVEMHSLVPWHGRTLELQTHGRQT